MSIKKTDKTPQKDVLKEARRLKVEKMIKDHFNEYDEVFKTLA